jgi:hypothetical protein
MQRIQRKVQGKKPQNMLWGTLAGVCGLHQHQQSPAMHDLNPLLIRQNAMTVSGLMQGLEGQTNVARKLAFVMMAGSERPSKARRLISGIRGAGGQGRHTSNTRCWSCDIRKQQPRMLQSQQ